MEMNLNEKIWLVRYHIIDFDLFGTKTLLLLLFRSKVPALKVKMWYVPELELPAKGCVMKGATLVVVKPVEEWSKADDGRDLVAGGFGFAREGKEEKVFDEVAKELVKLKRSYSLEMNSF